jgi:hypothetical protein
LERAGLEKPVRFWRHQPQPGVGGG